MEPTEVPAIVCDNGSGMIKAGFAGDDTPFYVFPPVVGRPDQSRSMQQDLYVGYDALAKRPELLLTHPIEHGVITNWVDMEAIWNHTFFNELRVAPEERPVLLTETPLNTSADREHMTEIMFERFHVPALYIKCQGVLSLYSAGRSTGVALDCGAESSHAVPVYEGCALVHTIHRSEIAGRALTDYLSALMTERGLFPTSENLCGIKEKLCYVALDFDTEISRWKESQEGFKAPYQLPDGKSIEVSSERFLCPELLMNPSLIKSARPGVHEMIYNSIIACEPCIRWEMYSNIVLSGGTTLLRGLTDRLTKEIGSLAHGLWKIKVVAPSERAYSTWIGGSILASSSTSPNMWATKQEFAETGKGIVTRKCFC